MYGCFGVVDPTQVSCPDETPPLVPNYSNSEMIRFGEAIATARSMLPAPADPEKKAEIKVEIHYREGYCPQMTVPNPKTAGKSPCEGP